MRRIKIPVNKLRSTEAFLICHNSGEIQGTRVGPNYRTEVEMTEVATAKPSANTRPSRSRRSPTILNHLTAPSCVAPGKVWRYASEIPKEQK